MAQAIISVENTIIREDLTRITAANLPWEALEDKTVLITGGSGFLAAYLVKSLLTANTNLALNLNVICLVRNNTAVNKRLSAQLTDPHLSIIQHDITQPIPSHCPAADFVIHSASQASPKYYATDPVGTLLANTAGTQHLLTYAVKSHAEKFLFFSSGEVYGVPNDPSKLIDEVDYGYIDPMNVRACYAESKRIGETMCVAWAKQHGIQTSVVRPFHTYGPGMALDDGRVFADFVANVVAKEDIILKSDGLAKRPFCYIADATIGFLTVLLSGKNSEAYNVANPTQEIAIRDLATLVAGLMPDRNIATKFEVEASSQSYIKSPVMRACPSIAKINALGWHPTTNLKDGFSRTIRSYL